MKNEAIKALRASTYQVCLALKEMEDVFRASKFALKQMEDAFKLLHGRTVVKLENSENQEKNP